MSHVIPNRRRFALAFVATVLAIASFPQVAVPEASPTPVGSWALTGNMPSSHVNHTATVLPNGKVLVAGGFSSFCCTPVNTAALYDPSTQTWANTGSLITERYYFTATLLNSGMVLVVGGASSTAYLASAELYDPATGEWTETDSLTQGRRRHMATRLADGRVLVAGGEYSSTVTASAEIYDPATGLWTDTGDMKEVRRWATMTLLPNGKVLVTGGSSLTGEHATAELFDPTTGSWEYAAPMSQTRTAHSATLLLDGTVLVTNYSSLGLATERYHYDTNTWSPAGDLTQSPSDIAQAVLLPSGKVLLAGFAFGGTQLYDPASGSWSNTGTLVQTRNGFTLSVLPNGKALVTGGFCNFGCYPSPTPAPDDTAELYTEPSYLTSIAVTPDDPTMLYSDTQQLAAAGTYNDGTGDVTSLVTWTSSDPAVASVDANGMLTAATHGTTTITATLGAVSDSITVTVTAPLASIAVTPASPSIALGGAQQFEATGTYADSTTANLTASVTWMSSLPSVASITAEGFASTVGQGVTSISATLGAIVGDTTLTVGPAELVGVSVSPQAPSIPNNTTQQFTVNGSFTDGTSADVTASATWSSSDTGVATIDANGKATAVGVGQTTIAASIGDRSNTSVLTVVPVVMASIAVSPVAPTVALGLTRQFTATASFTDGSTQDVSASVTWASSDPTVATVNGSGLATALTIGTTQVSATAGVFSASQLVTVGPAVVVRIDLNPTTARVPVEGTQEFKATAVYSDGATEDVSSSVLWMVGNPEIAKIITFDKGAGTATGLADGSTSVLAFHSSGVNGTAQFNVGPEPPSPIVSISVGPANRTIGLGSVLPFVATATHENGNFSDATGLVVWSVVDETIATIVASGADSGKATGAGAGSTMVTATFNDLSGQALLTVSATPAELVTLKVIPADTQIAVGATQQFNAHGNYDDDTSRDVTALVAWRSAVEGVATIDGAGLATGIGEGSTLIRADLGVINHSVNLSVVPAAPELVQITISPNTPTVAVGSSFPLNLSGVYSDSKISDVTSLAKWTSDDEGLATVTDSLVTGVAVGQVTIRASIGKLEASVTLTVTGGTPTLVGITVTPAGASIVRKTTQQYAALGAYSDGSTTDLTGLANWSSSNPAAASITSGGLATGVEVGASTITAALDGVTGSVALNVIRNAREKPASSTQAVVHDDYHLVINHSVINRGVHPGVQVSGIGPVPTGTVIVQWFANGQCTGRNALASTTGALVNGVADLASFTQFPATPGLYSFLASYSGDAAYKASPAACAPVTVHARPQAAVGTSVHDDSHAVVTSVARDTPVHALVTLTGEPGTPVTGTATLTWFSNNKCSGRPAATSSPLSIGPGGVDATTFTQTPSKAGSYAFLATYSGDAYYAAGAGVCQVVVVR